MPSLPTCILVDDHAVVREALRTRIEELGILDVVGEASHCPGAIELIRRVRPTLALVDLRLPGGTGLNVVERLRQEGCATLLVIFSACGDPAVAASAQSVGADAFLTKDLPGTSFRHALEAVLSGRPFLSAIGDAIPASEWKVPA